MKRQQINPDVSLSKLDTNHEHSLPTGALSVQNPHFKSKNNTKLEF